MSAGRGEGGQQFPANQEKSSAAGQDVNSNEVAPGAAQQTGTGEKEQETLKHPQRWEIAQIVGFLKSILLRNCIFLVLPHFIVNQAVHTTIFFCLFGH